MKLPLEITVQGMPQSVEVETAARRSLDEKHRCQGRRFHVRSHVTVPGIELVSSMTSDEHVYVVLRDASKDYLCVMRLTVLVTRST